MSHKNGVDDSVTVTSHVAFYQPLESLCACFPKGGQGDMESRERTHLGSAIGIWHCCPGLAINCQWSFLLSSSFHKDLSGITGGSST